MINLKEYFLLYGKFYLFLILFSSGLLGLFFLHELPLEPFIDYVIFHRSDFRYFLSGNICVIYKKDVVSYKTY